MRVEALYRGYYGDMIREIGDKFEIKDESELGRWMKPLDKVVEREVEAPAPVVEAKPVAQKNKPSPKAAQAVESDEVM